MFKLKKENQEEKNKNEGFVDDKGQAIDPSANKPKEEKNPDDVDLNVKVEIDDDHIKNIEKSRIVFLKMMKKENILKWVSAVLALGLLIFSWLFLVGQLQMFALGYSLVGVSILIIVVYYILAKKINNKKMEEYLKVYYGETNASVFSNGRFVDVKGDISGKIDNDEFNNSGLYKDVSTIGSRNIVNFKIGEAKVKLCDCAAQKTTQKKLEPLFIGKYIVADNKYEGDEPIYIYLPGNSRALPPNNLDAIPKVVNTRKLVVYSKAKNYASAFNNKLHELVAKLITNNILVDASFAITKGHTYIGLGYDDCLMVLPLQEKFNMIPFNRYKSDMLIIADIISALN